ncbi:MAG: ABC transporter ATP-binding protein [Pseudomonadota bacterium]|nr:ABC transporter ATP-binding protein [Pseudomonadota bacterium]
MDRKIEKVLVEARGVNKHYPNFCDLKNISFSFDVGKSYGVLGPRNSGVTGLLRLIYCTAFSDKGEVMVLGYNAKNQPREIKSIVGVVPDALSLEEDLTVIEQLTVFGKFYDLAGPVVQNRARELLQQMELGGLEGYSTRHLSLFQRKKLCLARALLHQPQLLVLDEPTKGLTSNDKKWFLQMLQFVQKANINLVIGTSNYGDALELCDYILFLHNGRVIEQGEAKSLLTNIVGTTVIDFQSPPAEVEYQLAKFSNSYEVFIVDNRVRIFFKEGQDIKEALTKILSDNIITRKPNLDDIFVKLIGHSLEQKPWATT